MKEAKLLSKFIVSTNFAAVFNQLSHEENGLIAEMNYMSVADNICRVISDYNLRIQIEKNLSIENKNCCLNDISKILEVIS